MKFTSLIFYLHICHINNNLDATELLNYNKSEERKMEEMMEGIAATGVKAGTSLNTHTPARIHRYTQTYTQTYTHKQTFTHALD